MAVLVTCLQEGSHDHSHVIPSRALSPHLDSKISIHRYVCSLVHIKIIGIRGKGAVVWGIEWIVEKGRRGPITALGRRDNGAAKG